MTDALTYNQRLKLGAIRVRRDFADEARKRAVEASLRNDHRACEAHHAEADRHEAAIVEAARAFNLPGVPPLRAARARLKQVGTTVEPSVSVGRTPWRGVAEGQVAAIARPIDEWNKFVAKLG
jgi:hypothetical protein